MGGVVGLGPNKDGRAQPVDTGLAQVNNLLGKQGTAVFQVEFDLCLPSSVCGR